MADKSKTIKEATDKELDALLIRLEKEGRLQYLIAELKRKSSPEGFNSYGSQPVSTEEPIESLYHFGVNGMRWGRRKGVSSVSKSAKSKSTTSSTSDDFNKKTALKKKKISQMSNSELKDLTTRMQLEKQYKDLRKSEVSTGTKFVNDLLKDIGKEILKETIKSNTKNGISKLKDVMK